MLKLFSNSKFQKTCFYLMLLILVALFVLCFILTTLGINDGKHYLDEAGKFDPVLVVDIALDMAFYAVGFVILLSLHFEPIKKKRQYHLFMSLVVAIMANLIIDGISWYLSGTKELSPLIFMCGFLYYIISNASLTLLVLYIIVTTDSKKFQNRTWHTLILLLSGVSTTLIILGSITGTLFTVNDEGSFIMNSSQAFITQLPILALYILGFAVIFISKKNLRYKMILSTTFVFPLVSFVIDSFYGSLQIVLAFMMLSVLIITCTIHLSDSVALEAKEAELTNQKLSIMMNQIQPHFIYNVLSSIYYLCDKDGKKAKAAINDFSKYLRINIDSIDKNPIVSFKDELEFCRIYLSLEKMRFDDELNYEFDIEVSDFTVPSFSIQPLVENAVKHGVSQKIGGGTVRIEVKEYEDAYIIRIIDDGAGFDSSSAFSPERNHVGIKNVKYRIESLAGGTLTITSEVGKGTSQEVRIPKGDKNV